MGGISSGMYVIDPDYIVVAFNDTAASLYPQLEVGKPCHRCLMDLGVPCPACPVANDVKGPRFYFDPIRGIGETVDAVEMPLLDGRRGHALVFSTVDEAGARQAELDQQTGLLNREGFLHFCEDYKPEGQEVPVAAVAVDIVNVDVLISQLGTEAGDESVAYVASALKLTGATLAYVGGGRFLGFKELGAGAAAVLDDGAVRRVEAESPIRGLVLKAGVFCGLASDGSASALVRYAESALNTVRCDPRESCKVVDVEVYREIAAENERLRAIVSAIDSGEFDIFLQPKCRLSDGSLAGSEALARWIKPDGTVVPPSEFIPVLEAHGAVTKLDLYVWDLVFSTVRAWIDAGLEPLPVSLNVSRIDIRETDVPAELLRLAHKYDVHPSLVEVEITESAYVQDDGCVRQAVEELKAAGFHVLVDDFGSGYSSLSMLRYIDADILKLDMGFLDAEGGADTRTADIVRSVLDMAHQLGMCVIVEGVETLEQAEMLSLLGCQFVQGYYFYRPMSREQFVQLAKSSSCIPIPAESFRSNGKSNLQRLSDIFWRVGEFNVQTGEFRFFRTYPEPDFATVPRPLTLHEHGRRYADHGLVHPDDMESYLECLDAVWVRNNLDSLRGGIRVLFRFLDAGEYKWFVFEMRRPFDFDLESNPWAIITWKEAVANEADAMVAASPVVCRSASTDRESDCDSHDRLVFGPRVVLENLPGGFFVHEASGDMRILYANPEIVRMFGCNTIREFRELTGGTIRGVIHPDDLDLCQDVFKRQTESSRQTGGQLLGYVSHRIVKRDGSISWVQGYGRLLEHSVYGDICCVFVSEVADARMDIFKIASRMGASDILCDVLNRNSYEQRRGHLVAYPGGRAACVFMDANNLHEINETEGHEAGDEFLIAIAAALKAQFGAEDVFRVGGDEFIVLCRDLPESEVEGRMRRAAAQVGECGRSVACGYSFVEDLQDANRLVAEAEAQMRADKMLYHRGCARVPRF